MSTHFYQFLCSLLLTLTLSGCGFQLRGYNQELPFHTLYLESNPPYTNFSKELRQALKAANVDVYLSPPVPITLQIISQNFTRTITSLGNAGQTTTYLLSFTILFQLVDSSNHILLPPQQVNATRNFSITSNQLSGDLNTQIDLQEDMQRDAIQQLIARLASPALRRQFCQIYPPR
ncbi:MAG: LPS assembly lipoprotein LptE [Rickettsiella sp.]|nr:LPS assembly lipoprotein LptE [Rickettsiella sp.]